MRVFNILRSFLPLAAVATILSLLIYTAVQQNYRQGANDPQIQIAEDTANLLTSGGSIQSITPSTQVDLSKSLATFIIVYDSNGKELVSSAILDNKTPVLPDGVLNDAKNKGELRFTWEPKAGVREATVVAYYSGKTQGFILSGRSLKEVEVREDWLSKYVFLSWLGSLIASLFLITVFSKNSKS